MLVELFISSKVTPLLNTTENPEFITNLIIVIPPAVYRDTLVMLEINKRWLLSTFCKCQNHQRLTPDPEPDELL